jgi:glycosyltransferase involved in cell wall biosynthesis
MTYTFGFALTTALGNETRYLNLRKYVDRATDVEAIWAPIRHFVDPDPFRLRWPKRVHTQRVLNYEARPIYEHWASLDAVVLHVFQLHAYLTVRRALSRHKPLLVLAQDYAPSLRPTQQIHYGGLPVVIDWKLRTRFHLVRFLTRRADLYLPWSDWAQEALVEDCGVDPHLIHIIPPAVDLELWPFRPHESGAGVSRKLRVLFVGGDFVRKGGDALLDVYRDGLGAHMELDMVTRQPPANVPPGARVHTDMRPNDERLRDLYASCDVFALPTRADMSSIVSLEAMATGRPVISTRVGGIPSLISDNKTGFLIDPDDPAALRDRLMRFVSDPEQCTHMGLAAREDVEKRFSAQVVTEALLDALKRAVDTARAEHVGSRTRVGL